MRESRPIKDVESVCAVLYIERPIEVYTVNEDQRARGGMSISR